MYSVKCMVERCVTCRVQSETMCTLHGAVTDCVYNVGADWSNVYIHGAGCDFLYSVNCIMRLCAQCTVQSETVCTV